MYFSLNFSILSFEYTFSIHTSYHIINPLPFQCINVTLLTPLIITKLFTLYCIFSQQYNHRSIISRTHCTTRATKTCTRWWVFGFRWLFRLVWVLSEVNRKEPRRKGSLGESCNQPHGVGSRCTFYASFRIFFVAFEHYCRPESSGSDRLSSFEDL